MLKKNINAWFGAAALFIAHSTVAQTVNDQAEKTLKSMSLQDRLAIIHSLGGGGFDATSIPRGALGSAAFLTFSPHLHLPTLQYSDAGLGVGDPRNVRPHGIAVSLPAGLAIASTWDINSAELGGRMIGQEAWRTGFNILLAGGANLTRDPRNGRNFEYAGEDPFLTGKIVGATIKGIQSQHVMSTIKHFAMNDLETSRMTMSANIDPAPMRESDLLAFEIAIEQGHPGAVMCSYNRVNDIYACENSYLLTKTLKEDWKYPGFVMSDWGADHTGPRAALAGLDQESSGDVIDARVYFDKPLADAISSGIISEDRLNDMSRRILRSIYSVGIPSNPPVLGKVDLKSDMKITQSIEEEGAVLLKNRKNTLPISNHDNVLIIGGHADTAVLSGGGSSQVPAIGGNAVPVSDKNLPWPGAPVYFPDSPLTAMQKLSHNAVSYNNGENIQSAVNDAKKADVVIVFATKWATEAIDAPDMSLPDKQDDLITALAHVNPHVVVVLETGNPVLMPWLNSVGGVLQAWFPGSAGAHAIANLLYGIANPSGHLPMTFPRSAQQLPRPDIAGVKAVTAMDVQFFTEQEVFYPEGSDVGYRWFDRKHETPLFPFGFGLSYTTFNFSDFHVGIHNNVISATFTATNTGKMSGAAVPQIYINLPNGGARRLGGWKKVSLQPNETATETVNLDPRFFARFDDTQDKWAISKGDYSLHLAENATDNGIVDHLFLSASTMTP